MVREFHLFERRADGSPTYRGIVSGLENACLRVRLLAIETDHEFYALDSGTQQVAARTIPRLPPQQERSSLIVGAIR
jgi:hypothetical protein